MNQYFDLDKGKNVTYVNDCSTSGYSSGNSPTSTTMTLSPSRSPETALQNEFANLNLPEENSQLQFYQTSSYQTNQLGHTHNGVGNGIDGTNLVNGSDSQSFGNMYMNQDHHYFVTASPYEISDGNGTVAFGQAIRPMEKVLSREYQAVLEIAEQPVEKFRFRYKSEMHGTHGSLNGANSKRTPKTFPEVELKNYKGPAVIRCSLFQTNLDSPHSHQLVVRKDDRDVCDPHDLHVSKERGFVAQFVNMGIIHTAKKYIFDELLKKKQDRLVFEMGRREPSTKQIQELHQETEREAKDMNLNQVRLCFEAFKIEESGIWTRVAAPVFSNPINNRKSAQTGELRIVRLSAPTGGVMGNDELILLVEKVSKKNIKVRFFEENDDGEPVWEAYAKFRESDVHHQYAIVCQTPAYKDRDVDRDITVSIELIRPSDDERSYPPLPFRYKPREAIVSRKRRRTGYSMSSGSSSGSAQSSLELPRTLQQHSVADQTISQEFGRDTHLEDLISSPDFKKLVDDPELEKYCQAFTDIGEIQQDGHDRAVSFMANSSSKHRICGNRCLDEIYKLYEAMRSDPKLFDSCRKKFTEIFSNYAAKNDNNDTLLHELVSQKSDDLRAAIKAFKVFADFNQPEVANNAINCNGDSALHFACQQDRHHYIRPLLRLGCNPNIQNHSGNTALHMAVKEEHNGCVDSFLNYPGINLNLTLKNDNGLTALHMAIRQNKYELAKKLITYDSSSINVTNTKDGNNALHMAVLAQNSELLVLIMDAQNLSDAFKACNAAGYTPLQLARLEGTDECVRLLEAVCSERSDLAMTWIPMIVKEEIDSESADEYEESTEASLDICVDIKTEELCIKTEEEMLVDEESKPSLNLESLSKSQFDLLVTILNEQSTKGSNNLVNWRVVAKEANIHEITFLCTDAESMLQYIQRRSNNAELNAFNRALNRLDIFESLKRK